jgi:alpha-L-fucosidase 2
MDVVICREALSNLLEALRVLEETDEQEERYRQLLAALPPYQINAEGGLCEWMHPDLADVQTHVHMSHLYGLFPGWEINPGRHTGNPHLGRARSGIASERAGQHGRVESLFHGEPVGTLWARRQGAGKSTTVAARLYHAKPAELGQRLARHGLSCYWGQGALPPFQIEAGMGFVSAVCEMLVRSRPGFLRCFPPTRSMASWKRAGNHDALRSDGDMSWSENGRALSVELSSRIPQQITLHLPDHFHPSSQTLELASGSVSLEFRA